MARFPCISSKSVVSEYLDWSGHEGSTLDPVWLRKQANDAIARMSTDQQFRHVVEVLPIKDYKVKRPEYFRYLCQAAYRIAPPAPCSREEISQFKQKILGSDCELEINIKCPQCHTEKCECNDRVAVEVDVNRIYETAHPEYFSRYMGHFYKSGNTTSRGTTSIYHDQFCLMKKTSTTFRNIPYHIGECINLSVDCEIEYDIDSFNITVNFKEGEILIAYLAWDVDEEGYLYVPEDAAVFTAINWWIEERVAFKKYRESLGQNIRIFWQQTEQQKLKYLRAAKGRLQMPDPDEWWQFVENHWRKVIPYRNWDRNFNRNTGDRFRYPDQTRNFRH